MQEDYRFSGVVDLCDDGVLEHFKAPRNELLEKKEYCQTNAVYAIVIYEV
jgi:hypothetical protein